jgi:hypothetical protein
MTSATTNTGYSPVFIHGFWRTGSTYVWKKYRDDSRFRAYCEPLHEIFIDTREEDARCTFPLSSTQVLRHPDVSEFYFDEYPFRPEGGVVGFRKYFPYERYCLTPDECDEPLRAYVANLINLSKIREKTPVLQFNRALLRAGWLRRQFGGSTILLLRRPLDVWRSCRSFPNRYFLATFSCILGQNQRCPIVAGIAGPMGVPYFVSESFREDYEVYYKWTLAHENQLYPFFYQFYILAAIECAKYSDCILDLNALSTDVEIRGNVAHRLTELGAPVSFSDCAIPLYDDLTAQEQESLGQEHALRRQLQGAAPDLGLAPSINRMHQGFLSPYFRDVFNEFTLPHDTDDAAAKPSRQWPARTVGALTGGNSPDSNDSAVAKEALLNLDDRLRYLSSRYDDSEAARLRRMLAESEADRAARLSVIEDLSAQLAASEADRAARLSVIEDLSAQLAASEADRAARLSVIEDLSAQLAASEADRAARLSVIEDLSIKLADSEADRAARLQVIHEVSAKISALEEDCRYYRKTLDDLLSTPLGRLLCLLGTQLVPPKPKSTVGSE